MTSSAPRHPTPLPRHRQVPLLATLLLSLVALALAGAARAQAVRLAPGDFDVIVVGSEPEAISAAVAAGESGARTLLLSHDDRLGGLFVLGGLNVLDLRNQPVPFQQGLFLRWWRMVGGQHAFDVRRAEVAFAELLERAGVEVRLAVEEIRPSLGPAGWVLGVEADGALYTARHVIDGTADMDLAAAAGARYTVGFSSLGFPARMADTLVLRIDGVDWQALGRGVRARGRDYAVIDDTVAWGHFGGYPSAYVPTEPGLRLRGLNLGRQEDGSVLVNALLVFDVDPFDPASRRASRERALQEGPRLIEYLSRAVPGFENARFGGGAERLYIRESRHLEALCSLTSDDLLDNRVTPFDVVAGGYPLDVQALSRTDTGFVFGTPDIYGAQLCVTIPRGLDGLWVVGRSAGFDPIAASSARVVPFGMALAEAVGVAAAMANDAGVGPRTFVDDPAAVLALRERLLARGAYLPEVRERRPVGPFADPNYDAFRLLLTHGLAVGGYRNDPGLDQPMAGLGFLYLLANVGTRFYDEGTLGLALLERFGEPHEPLSSGLALELTASAACRLGHCPDEISWEALRRLELAPPGLPREGTLTRGEAYALAARLARLAVGAGPPG